MDVFTTIIGAIVGILHIGFLVYVLLYEFLIDPLITYIKKRIEQKKNEPNLIRLYCENCKYCEFQETNNGNKTPAYCTIKKQKIDSETWCLARAIYIDANNKR